MNSQSKSVRVSDNEGLIAGVLGVTFGAGVGMMKRITLCIPIAAMVLITPSKAQDQWVEVTKPVLACEAAEDDPSLPRRLFDSLLRVRAYQAAAEGCKALEVGDKLLLDNKQTEDERKLFVKSWRRVCTQGCSPYRTPVYSPSRTQVGAYLRPTAPP
jgi:hypothetical protein